jgi:hypothetical protein
MRCKKRRPYKKFVKFEIQGVFFVGHVCHDCLSPREEKLAGVKN